MPRFQRPDTPYPTKTSFANAQRYENLTAINKPLQASMLDGEANAVVDALNALDTDIKAAVVATTLPGAVDNPDKLLASNGDNPDDPIAWVQVADPYVRDNSLSLTKLLPVAQGALVHTDSTGQITATRGQEGEVMRFKTGETIVESVNPATLYTGLAPNKILKADSNTTAKWDVLAPTDMPTDIDGSKIKWNSMPGTCIKTTSILGDRLGYSTITGDKIAAATITGDKIAPLTITGDKIAAKTVTIDQLKDMIGSKNLAPITNGVGGFELKFSPILWGVGMYKGGIVQCTPNIELTDSPDGFLIGVNIKNFPETSVPLIQVTSASLQSNTTGAGSYYYPPELATPNFHLYVVRRDGSFMEKQYVYHSVMVYEWRL